MIEKLQIGPVTYAVVVVPDLRSAFNDEGEPIEGDEENGKLLNGQIIYHRMTIELNANLPVAFQPIVLLHEAIHGVLSHAGIEHDEGTVQALGYGLVDLLRDNPDLVRLIVA